MITSKPIEAKFGGGESTFGITFREEHPDIAKELSDGNGPYMDGKTVNHDGYTYRAKVVQNGKYIFVERRKVGSQQQSQQSAPAQAPAATNQNPARMTALEFDEHAKAIAKQFVKYLSELAPYTSMSLIFAKKEGQR
jgi:hypothetical protein